MTTQPPLAHVAISMIEKMPPSQLPPILVAVIKACLKHELYGNRKISEIVATMEKQFGKP